MPYDSRKNPVGWRKITGDGPKSRAEEKAIAADKKARDEATKKRLREAGKGSNVRSAAIKDVVKNSGKISTNDAKKAYRKGAAKAAAKAAGRGVTGALTPGFVAYDLYDSYEQLKDVQKRTSDMRKPRKGDYQDRMKTIRKESEKTSSEEKQRRIREANAKAKAAIGMKKGGEVKARGCGIAVQGTKFRGVK